MLCEEILEWSRKKARVLFNTNFCKFWKTSHDDCTGCSSEQGCKMYGILLEWENHVLDGVIEVMEEEDAAEESE